MLDAIAALACSKVLQFLLYISLLWAVIGVGAEPSVASVNNLAGWGLATILWHASHLRYLQVLYLVSEIKKTGAKVYNGDEEL
jgi:hypothetical protein